MGCGRSIAEVSSINRLPPRPLRPHAQHPGSREEPPRFVETHPGRGGPCVGSLFRCYSQPYSPLAILTALTLRALFRLGLRQTEGLIASIPRLLGLDLAVPDHTTLSRRGGGLAGAAAALGRRAAAPAGGQHRPA